MSTVSNSIPDEKRMRALDKLSVFETEVMEVLCLCYRAVSHADLLSLLKARLVNGENEKLVTAAGLLQTLESLKSRTLVEAKGKNWQSARDITEVVTRRMVLTDRFAAALPSVRNEVAPSARWGYSSSYVSDEELVGLIRIALYDRDFKRLDNLFSVYFERPVHSRSSLMPISRIINSPFDASWFSSYPVEKQALWLNWLIQDLSNACERSEPALKYAGVLAPSLPKDERVDLDFVVGDSLFLQGRLSELQALAGEMGLVGDLLIARCELVTGEIASAISRYESALQEIKQGSRKRKPTFGTNDWVYFIIALIAGGDEHWPRAAELADWGARDKNAMYQEVCGALLKFLRIQNGQIAGTPSTMWYSARWSAEQSAAMKFMSLLVDFWSGLGESMQRDHTAIAKLCSAAGSHGYSWIEHELGELLQRMGVKVKRVGKLDTVPLVEHFRSSEPWERTLKALANISRGDVTAKVENPTRLVWMLHFQGGHCSVEPLEQKRSPKGTWSKGRVASLQRLRENSQSLDYLTAHDRLVCSHIKTELDGGYWNRHRTSYFLGYGALPALAGHPNVFLSDTGANVEVATASPSLEVSSTKKGFVLKVTPVVPDGTLVHVEREGDLRVVVYEFTPELARVAEMLGKGLEVPARAKDRVLQAVRSVASVLTVHSDLGVGDESIPRVDADVTPVLQLLPAGEGLLVQLRVRPLPGGPAFAPAVGGDVVIADVNGTRLQAARDMKQESARADALVASCKSLISADFGTCEWRLETPEEALEFLAELETAAAGARVEWPKGQKFALQGTAGVGQFRAKINAGHNWFELSGDIKVNDELVLDMQRLMELTAGTRSRFVPLGDGQFLALTQAFKRKLDELRGVGESADGALRMHALAAPLMDGFIEQAAALKANKPWKEQITRMQAARDLEPEVPSTLRAILREYQITGFQWLARLAEWGVGACLADDMGLGKTVQLLAVMLRRAPGGPQLVIAPTSVCANWEEEASRFAPTLRVHRLGLNNRADTVEMLGAHDLLICSYGLLQTETALLKSIQWETIVLDEAQAIKNASTKRSKAAMELESGFKVAATGTPIENHLGELWNLFHFINPGFLGSQQQFNGRFALPIEKYENKDAGRHLKQLIQPFILRRRKEEVLSELPARTDIVLHMELGDEERAFYEALRRNALKEISSLQGGASKHHVRILAEIMRLRRACCNARLVDGDSSLPSAKLEVFEALLDELMENGHKALVFSQFVGHLEILRDLLDRKGVAYQYLDGSTPATARKKAVDAFQGGNGEVFLISLKAGGLGLNLTAADYVIHMDPWWNPAVEDQASDRAHRIGQQRPVTVYRLVARSTIEDQITALHHRKRDLANSLLEGADMAGKISSEELLEMLRMG
jgi:hypothetical protein